jgi:hypothetical protein
MLLYSSLAIGIYPKNIRIFFLCNLVIWVSFSMKDLLYRLKMKITISRLKFGKNSSIKINYGSILTVKDICIYIKVNSHLIIRHKNNYS